MNRYGPIIIDYNGLIMHDQARGLWILKNADC